MVYANPQGHDWSDKYNWDGIGISYVVFAVVYSAVFYSMCAMVWYYRKHPVIKMRNIGLAISSLLILHVYLFLIFIAYPLNGHYPCDIEFWIMSIYLPIGIGLFQAQNQQLLLVSREQNKLIVTDEMFKPLGPPGKGPKKWLFQLKCWWHSFSEQGKYEGFVAMGIIGQFLVSMVIFFISRKFGSTGLVSERVSRGMCRRGWEWVPSIVWQFIWNYFCGPALIWKIRMIRDIYHWRLQTILCVVAGLPGSPMWLISAYSDSFASINKYWIPAAWFVPGLITMEMVTLSFPIYQIYKHKKAVRETTKVIQEWEYKKRNCGSTDGSITTRGSKGRMWSMQTLDDCLENNKYHSLQLYASCMELNGENIIFLVKVLNFKKQWALIFAKAGDQIDRARMAMFRNALSIYVSLVHDGTSNYPINVESFIYTQLNRLFGNATLLVASRRPSTPNSTISVATPWDELGPHEAGTESGSDYFQMSSLQSPPKRRSFDHESSERIISLDEPVDPNDPLNNYHVPAEFDVDCFDAAAKSIKYMVWTETWQRYNDWRQHSPCPAS